MVFRGTLRAIVLLWEAFEDDSDVQALSDCPGLERVALIDYVCHEPDLHIDLLLQLRQISSVTEVRYHCDIVEMSKHTVEQLCRHSPAFKISYTLIKDDTAARSFISFCDGL